MGIGAVWRGYRWFGRAHVLAGNFPPRNARDWQHYSATLVDDWAQLDVALGWWWEQMRFANNFRQPPFYSTTALGEQYRAAVSQLLDFGASACQWSMPLSDLYFAIALVRVHIPNRPQPPEATRDATN